MNKLLPVLLLLLFTQSILAQSVFEPASYKDNDGNIIEGFIKNLDWRSNPTKLDFKSSLEESDFVTLTINDVSEFEIFNYGKFIRSTVQVDRTTEDKTKLSRSPIPEFNTEILFLKVLLEGDASLYSYQSGNIVRYFFSTKGSKIEQLVFRLYQNNNTIVTDNSFKNQLNKSLICKELEYSNFQELEYDQKDLVALFNQYLSCSDLPKTVYNYSRDYKRFRISLKPSFNYSSLEVSKNTVSLAFSRKSTVDLGNSFGYKIGTEFEFIFPFDNGKWSFVVEPTFNRYKTSKKVVLSFTENDISLDYTSLEVPFGLRYKVFVNNNSLFYMNPFFVYDFAINSQLNFNGAIAEIKPRPNLMLGIGYRVKEFSFETRYSFKRELFSSSRSRTTSNSSIYTSDYQYISFIIGYSIF